MGALSGIRVIDFTRVVAGPYCTMLLGDLGAEVIKIEQPGRGDDSRGWGPPFVEGESTYFLAINRNKKSVCLDLHNEKDQEVARRLVLQSDVMIENFRTGLAEQFGLGYTALQEQHPGLIYCAISGYGRSGPYKNRAGYDVTISAMAGLMGINGNPGEPPVKTAVPLLDVITGLYAFSGILAALYHREHSGQGQRVDISLLNAQLATLLNAASAYLNAGEIPQPQGSAHGSIVPYQVFRAADGYIMIGAPNEKLYQELCRELGHPEWSSDPRFRTNADRVHNREAIIALIGDVIEYATVSEWEQRLAAANIAVAPINRMDQVFQDLQVQHTQQVVTMHHKTAGDIKVIGPAATFSLTPARAETPPPLLGEHTEEVVQAILQQDRDAPSHD